MAQPLTPLSPGGAAAQNSSLSPSLRLVWYQGSREGPVTERSADLYSFPSAALLTVSALGTGALILAVEPLCFQSKDSREEDPKLLWGVSP